MRETERNRVNSDKMKEIRRCAWARSEPGTWHRRSISVFYFISHFTQIFFGLVFSSRFLRFVLIIIIYVIFYEQIHREYILTLRQYRDRDHGKWSDFSFCHATVSKIPATAQKRGKRARNWIEFSDIPIRHRPCSDSPAKFHSHLIIDLFFLSHDSINPNWPTEWNRLHCVRPHGSSAYFNN